MKPAAFEYVAPTTVDETLDVLAKHGEDAKILAGGQSLVPLLNFRMARPALLVDVNGVDGLDGVYREDGTLYLGARTREAVLERSAVVGEHWPVLSEAAGQIGHPAIRNRGTVGGSVAHADPAAELPVVLTALDARFRMRSAAGERTLDAASFFVSYLTTALRPDELLVEIQVPALGETTGCAFREYARLHGDFALAGAAAVVDLDARGRCGRVRLALLGAGGTPVRAHAAEDALLGRTPDDSECARAADLAASESEPPSPVDHRRALLAEFARRALVTAAGRARKDGKR
ncbi:MAG: FAD binding domain-containing protein [Sciscionella sp.]